MNLEAYDAALNAFAQALEHEIANGPSLDTDPPVIKAYADRLRQAEVNATAARDNADYWRRKWHDEPFLEQAAQKVIEWADRIGGFEAQLLAVEIRNLRSSSTRGVS